MIERITPEMVKAAYEKTGLKPGRGEYLSKKDNTACGIGVVAAAVVGADLALIERWVGDASDYVQGFIGGFDGDQTEEWTEDGQRGREDGLACAAAVFVSPIASDVS